MKLLTFKTILFASLLSYGRPTHASDIVCVDKNEDGGVNILIKKEKVIYSTPTSQLFFKESNQESEFDNNLSELINEKTGEKGTLTITHREIISRSNTNLGVQISAKLTFKDVENYFFNCHEIK